MKTILARKNYLHHFRGENIYLMHNHRFSLWVWLNEIEVEEFEKLILVHIDTHHDCGEAGFGEYQIIKKDNINEFKNLEIFNKTRFDDNGKSKLFNCGSFFSDSP